MSMKLSVTLNDAQAKLFNDFVAASKKSDVDVAASVATNEVAVATCVEKWATESLRRFKKAVTDTAVRKLRVELEKANRANDAAAVKRILAELDKLDAK